MHRPELPSRVVIATAPAETDAGLGWPSWRLFKACRNEHEDGLYAMLPPDYFPVYPSSKPLLVKVPTDEPGAVAEAARDGAVRFECVPAPRRPLQFFRQLYDGTFVRLPHGFPDECYEGEAPPADRFYLAADVDPLALAPEEMGRCFARLPEAFQRELRRRAPRPAALPLPHLRYVLRAGAERPVDGRLTEDCFERVDTRLLRLERRPAERGGGGGGPVRARSRASALR
ncbi:16.1 kDa protein [Caprine alphaherpesvirus 1]|uniref:16.1 kDa protein n=1 Tax=Caprine alphaherpesvirus 1 TaxID=39944 RepID=A0AAE6CZS0_9ALPH|nr:16.1 kDa protein [Caprine alphaherpesvirus 1]QBM10905.1 16.1 kDa protein [Caprine alphaherpesvirus 1]